MFLPPPADEMAVGALPRLDKAAQLWAWVNKAQVNRRPLAAFAQAKGEQSWGSARRA